MQKAVNAVRQRETVKKQQATLRGTATSTEDTIDTVQRTTLPHKSQKATSRGDRARGTGTHQNKHKNYGSVYAKSSTSKNICTRCGKYPNHPRQQCPAREATCHHCSKKGYFKSMCKSKNVIADISDSEEELVFLDTVHSEIAVVDGNTKPWVMDIQLNGESIEFKIDTGADVTVIPAATYKASRDKRLQPAGRILCGPSQHPLSVLGKF